MPAGGAPGCRQLEQLSDGLMRTTPAGRQGTRPRPTLVRAAADSALLKTAVVRDGAGRGRRQGGAGGLRRWLPLALALGLLVGTTPGQAAPVGQGSTPGQ